MTPGTVSIRLDPESGLQTLRGLTVQQLTSTGGELVLDIEPLGRVDTDMIHAMEMLAEMGERASVRLVLRGANVAVYRVLKLTGLAQRFRFAAGNS
jgi:anti-anti-sigma regulatory factor